MTMIRNEKYLCFFIVILLIIVIYKVCSNKNENFDIKKLPECIEKSNIINNLTSISNDYKNANYNGVDKNTESNVKQFANNSVTCETDFYNNLTKSMPLHRAQKQLQNCMTEINSKCTGECKQIFYDLQYKDEKIMNDINNFNNIQGQIGNCTQ